MSARIGRLVWKCACLIGALVLTLAHVDRALAQAPVTNEQQVFSLSSSNLFFSTAQNSYARVADFSLRQDTEGQAADEPAAGGEEEFKDETGTDPRDFNNKFMPYYRYTELKNGVEVHDWTIFGLYAFTPRLAMTYEIPLRYMDYSEAIPDFGPAILPGGPPIPGFGASGPVSGSNEFGLGDSIFRFFYKPESLEWETPCTWGPRKGETLGWSLIPLIETTVPTNTDDILGSDTWVLSPGFAIAGDTPTFGFIAAMFFYDFNVIKDTDEPYVSRFRGRIFLMQPFSKPGPKWHDGLYMMPEFQPAYDLRTSHFSFWVGPEFGKVFAGDRTVTVYAKPGWGVDPNIPGDREFSFEFGVRIFF